MLLSDTVAAGWCLSGSLDGRLSAAPPLGPFAPRSDDAPPPVTVDEDEDLEAAAASLAAARAAACIAFLCSAAPSGASCPPAPSLSNPAFSV